MLFPKLRRKAKPYDGPTLRGRPCSMATLRAYVFKRDQGCVARLYAIGVEPHECRDQWGMPHRPTDLWRLTLAHVPEQGQNALGMKPPDDELHTVAECYGSNVFPGPSRELRAFERAWIADHEDATIASPG